MCPGVPLCGAMSAYVRFCHDYDYDYEHDCDCYDYYSHYYYHTFNRGVKVCQF